MPPGENSLRLHFVALAGFVGLLLAIGFHNLATTWTSPQRRATTLILYILAVSFFAGITQRSLFPFPSWHLISWIVPEWESGRLTAVDDTGEEHDVDYRVWQPLSRDELVSWMLRGFHTIDPGTQARIGSWLLARAEASRGHALATGDVGYWDRFLGPFTAPTFSIHPAIWKEGVHVPSRPFVAIRFDRETWNIQERKQTGRVTRELEFEYPSP
jgi:hypothetical protein